MKLKSKLLLALLATSAAAFAQTAPAAPESTLGYNVGVASEYRYRGIAQTKGDPALQGGVDYANTNGFYAGAWGSTIKWIKEAGTDVKGPVELDIYGGYKFEAAGLAYDVGYLRYEYVGNTYNKIAGNVNANTDEAYGAVTAGPATLKYSYAFSDLFGTANSKGSTYWDLSATFDLGEGYSLVPHAGRQVIKNSANSYTDIALTLNKDLGDGLAASAAFISTNAKNNAYYSANNSSYNTAKNALVLGVKYSF
ncbi:TorF family putative porin [Limnohabitans sp.]|uniref:TorF family putative porin n=1 Tax=Limnohabitans sp. TaxID=1907725 RepID=UPI00286F3F19|nr:TorF family putative porin [Limnohabitans sp.]